MAARAAAALKEELEVETEMVKGSGGIFEVAVDGKVVSKKSLGMFPSERDILDAVGKALSGV